MKSFEISFLYLLQPCSIMGRLMPVSRGQRLRGGGHPGQLRSSDHNIFFQSFESAKTADMLMQGFENHL